MAVDELVQDTWLAHLPYAGPPRDTQFGLMDGIFYGNLAVVGDGSGGNVSLTGELSRDKKEDWVYVLGGYSATRNTAISTNMSVLFTSGPRNQRVSGVGSAFQIFRIAGPISLGAGVATYPGGEQGAPFIGTPLFGDKKITAGHTLAAVEFGTNTSGTTYTFSMWGYLIKYATFFRGVPPERA